MSEARNILKRNLEKYSRSTLFIYFQGRLERIEVKLDETNFPLKCFPRKFLLFLQKDLSRSLQTFLSGLSSNNNQTATSSTPKGNELEQILVYDIGFCYMMMWNFETSISYFDRLVFYSMNINQRQRESFRQIILFRSFSDFEKKAGGQNHFIVTFAPVKTKSRSILTH